MPERPVPGRPRPVADAAVAALASRTDEVAKRWLVALVEAAPLADAAAVPVDELARDAPAFCEAVLRAVGSDAALAALLADGADPGASDLVRLSGALDSPGAVAAAEALRRAIQQEAAAEVAHADAAALAALGDRLAHVCARVAAAALSVPGRAARPVPGAQEPAGEDEPRVFPGPDRRRSGDRAEPGVTAPLWLAALDRQIAGGGRFGLLLLELDGIERLRPAEGEQGARELFGQVGRAVRGRLRRPDLLAHDDEGGRLWIVAPEAGRQGAAALAARVAEAVEDAASSRGVALTASVGVAMYPDDGREAEELTAQAEEGMFAARAAGVRVAAHPDEPAARGPRAVP
jgi:GGDEF domain-containing protein